MRSFLAWLASLAVFASLAGWAATPTLAGAAVAAGWQAAGLTAASLEVAVDTDPPLLFRSQARSMQIRISGAAYRGLHIAEGTLAFSDVDWRAHSCAALAGDLDGVSFPSAGSTMIFGHAELSGPCGAIAASLRLSASDARALVAAAVGQATEGYPDQIDFSAPDGLAVSMGGAILHGRLLLDASGGIRLHLEDIAQHLAFDIPLIGAADLSPFALAGVQMDAAGMIVLATLPPGMLRP